MCISKRKVGTKGGFHHISHIFWGPENITSYHINRNFELKPSLWQGKIVKFCLIFEIFEPYFMDSKLNMLQFFSFQSI